MRARPRFAALYAAWILVCAVLVFALARAEDPSRRSDRILSNDAGRIALSLLRGRDHRFSDYEVVHVAYAKKREGAAENRWIVLVDSVPHSALRNALVVELDAADGKLLRIRKPA